MSVPEIPEAAIEAAAANRWDRVNSGEVPWSECPNQRTAVATMLEDIEAAVPHLYEQWSKALQGEEAVLRDEIEKFWGQAGKRSSSGPTLTSFESGVLTGLERAQAALSADRSNLPGDDQTGGGKENLQRSGATKAVPPDAIGQRAGRDDG